MKQTHVVLLATCLLSGLSGISQNKIAQTRAQLLKLSPASKLNWYATAMTKLTLKGSSNSGSSVLSTRTESGNRTEIGIGLTGSEDGFTPNGNTRQETGGNSVCTYQPMRVNYVTSRDFNLFDENAGIYPGQFFTVNSILNNSFSAATTPQRKNYQIGISIFNPNNPGPGFLNIEDLTRSPLPEIQRQLLAPSFGAAIPAQGVLDMSEITSTAMLKAKFETSSGIFLPLQELGIPAEITAGFQGSGNTSNTTRKKVYMLNFIQPMYTLSVLTNHNQLFQSPNSHTGLTNAGYVESVTYGRRVVILISSTSSLSRVKAAMSAAISAEINGTEAADIEVGSKVSGETSASLREVATTFHAQIYGGEGRYANAIFSNILEFRDAFKQYINSSSASRFTANTTALPLHYTIRRISDDALLSVRSIGNYDELVSCNTSNFKVEIQYKGFTVNKVVELFPDSEEDIYGDFSLQSITTNGSTSSKNLKIKSISKSNAISKGANKTDDDDITVMAMNNISETNLKATTLNFSQDIHDWEPAHEPTYKPESSAELKFNFANEADDISRMTPGSSKTFTKNIKLIESGPLGESKITLLVKIRVTKS
ncbi:thiol-activated cytolysin family protein [Terrimonas sp. NA20]|uniref:Thiol-activated cytolysin family protein n=1 Tax=Terrimonas ginsenosidimutans TaxID=2908004 RepID=A0ABS9KNH9_9BACT|nr:thiol-activated cytolysin family protein [Terrimonas ginsenosidimutans]MCG2613870.1 thiol-activated cytolysin family protein [Terrimonas ginsenosidimutans]